MTSRASSVQSHPIHSSLKVALALLAGGVALTSHLSTAHADSNSQIAVDLDFGAALDEVETEAGGGGAIRFGRKWDLLVVSLTPEIGGAYHGFAGEDETKVYAGFIGARLGVGKVIEPSVFAHAGIARIEGIQSRTLPQLDGGLALDFTLLPVFNFGAHAGYNVLLGTADDSSLSWLTLGLHAAIVF